MVLFLIAPNFTPSPRFIPLSYYALSCHSLDEKVSHPNSRDWNPRIASAPNDADQSGKNGIAVMLDLRASEVTRYPSNELVLVNIVLPLKGSARGSVPK
jgi:hypothetical protein